MPQGVTIGARLTQPATTPQSQPQKPVTPTGDEEFERGVKAIISGRPVDQPNDIHMRIAAEEGVDPRLVNAIRGQEGTPSGVTSGAGAQGDMQVMPTTALGPGLKGALVTPAEWNTREGKIRAGVRYLKQLTDKYGIDNADQIAAAYHAGPGAVDAAIASGKRLPHTIDQYVSRARGKPFYTDTDYVPGFLKHFNGGQQPTKPVNADAEFESGVQSIIKSISAPSVASGAQTSGVAQAAGAFGGQGLAGSTAPLPDQITQPPSPAIDPTQVFTPDKAPAAGMGNPFYGLEKPGVTEGVHNAEVLDQQDALIDQAFGRGIGYQSRALPPEARAKVFDNAQKLNEVNAALMSANAPGLQSGYDSRTGRYYLDTDSGRQTFATQDEVSQAAQKIGASATAAQEQKETKTREKFSKRMVARNARYASTTSPDKYITKLEPDQETAFQQWLATQNVQDTSDYDYRGFYQAQLAGDPRAVRSDKGHFPDVWKTPEHVSFSRESIYAKPNGPRWNKKDQLIDERGRVLFDQKTGNAYDYTQGDAARRRLHPRITSDDQRKRQSAIAEAKSAMIGEALETAKHADDTLAQKLISDATNATDDQVVKWARGRTGVRIPSSFVLDPAKSEKRGGFVLPKESELDRIGRSPEFRATRIVGEEQARTVMPGDQPLEERINARLKTEGLGQVKIQPSLDDQIRSLSYGSVLETPADRQARLTTLGRLTSTAAARDASPAKRLFGIFAGETGGRVVGELSDLSGNLLHALDTGGGLVKGNEYVGNAIDELKAFGSFMKGRGDVPATGGVESALKTGAGFLGQAEKYSLLASDRLPFWFVMGGEAALQNQDKPLKTQAWETGKGLVTGLALEYGVPTIAKAFGKLPGRVGDFARNQPQLTHLLTAGTGFSAIAMAEAAREGKTVPEIIGTGLGAFVGASLLSVRGAVKESAPDIIASESTPEAVRWVFGKLTGKKPVVVVNESGDRAASVYVDPNNGEQVRREISIDDPLVAKRPNMTVADHVFDSVMPREAQPTANEGSSTAVAPINRQIPEAAGAQPVKAEVPPVEPKSPAPGVVGQPLNHPNEVIAGKEIVATTDDGRAVVANDQNKGGVSIVKPQGQEQPVAVAPASPAPVAVKEGAGEPEPQDIGSIVSDVRMLKEEQEHRKAVSTKGARVFIKSENRYGKVSEPIDPNEIANPDRVKRNVLVEVKDFQTPEGITLPTVRRFYDARDLRPAKPSEVISDFPEAKESLAVKNLSELKGVKPDAETILGDQTKIDGERDERAGGGATRGEDLQLQAREQESPGRAAERQPAESETPATNKELSIGEPQKVLMHVAGPSGSGKTELMNAVGAKAPNLNLVDLDEFDDKAVKALGWTARSKNDYTDEMLAQLHAKKQALVDRYVAESDKPIVFFGHHVEGDNELSIPAENRILMSVSPQTAAINADRRDATRRPEKQNRPIAENVKIGQEDIDYLTGRGYQSESPRRIYNRIIEASKAVVEPRATASGQDLGRITPKQIVRHSDPIIDGGEVVGTFPDGDLKVRNNEGGISRVQHPRREGNREATLAKAQPQLAPPQVDKTATDQPITHVVSERPVETPVESAELPYSTDRIRKAVESKNMADVQALLDDALKHRREQGGNRRLSRLITALRAATWRLRQPELEKGRSKIEASARPSAITQTRQEYVAAELKLLKEGDDPFTATENAKNRHDRAVKQAARKGKFSEMVSAGEMPPERAIEVLKSLGKRVPNAIRKELAWVQGKAFEVVGRKMVGRVGKPRSDPARNSEEAEVRARGGVKTDPDGNNRGEVRALKESGKQGLVNETSGTTAETMALTLAEDGYGIGRWAIRDPDGHLDVDGDAFLDSVAEDAAGTTRHHSAHYDPEIADHLDHSAFDALEADPYGKDLLDLVQSGHARASDIAELTRQAKEHGLSDEGLNAFLNALDETIEAQLPETPEGRTAEHGYSLDANGTLIDPDGEPLFALSRPQQLGFVGEGLVQQQVRASDAGRLKVPEQSKPELDARLTRLADDGSPFVKRAAKALVDAATDNPRVSDVLTALDKLSTLKKSSTSVSDYLLQRPLFDDTELSNEQKTLVRALDGATSIQLPRLIDSYLAGASANEALQWAQTEPMDSQSALFAQGSDAPSGWERAEAAAEDRPEFSVEGNRVIFLGGEPARLLDAAMREQPTAFEHGGRVGGVTLKRPSDIESLIKRLRAIKQPLYSSPWIAAQELANNIVIASEGATRPVLIAPQTRMPHEAFHEQSRLLTDATPVSSLEVWPGVKAQLMEMGYPDNDQMLAEEAAAHIAEGRYEQLGLSRDEAIDYMDAMFTALTNQHPDLSVDNFKELSNEAEEARNRFYDTTTRAEKPQPSQDVSRLEEGRKGRAREDVAFEGQQPAFISDRESDPWLSLANVADELDRWQAQPIDIPEGEKRRSLPVTLEAAEMETGSNLTYRPTTIAEGLDAGKQMVADKGIDGAIEYVKAGDGIEWASTGYEILAQLRQEESKATTDAAKKKISDKRLEFLNEFVTGATERGRSIVGIKAIEEFAPDRAAYLLNKLSLKARNRGISAEEDARVTALGEELQAAHDRNAALETALAAAEKRAAERVQREPTAKTKKYTYETRLDEIGAQAREKLIINIGHLDFSKMELAGVRKGEAGKVTLGVPPLPGDAELLAQYAASRLNKLDTVAELNDELVKEFGDQVEQFLPQIRQRAYTLRAEARIAELEAQETETTRRRTILQDIQKELLEAQSQAKEATRQSELAKRTTKAEAAKAEKTTARKEAKSAKEQESAARKQLATDARARAKEIKREYREAEKADLKGYRDSVAAQRRAARVAGLWDTPIRDAAVEARQRINDLITLHTASGPVTTVLKSDRSDPQVLSDLVSVAAEKFLPEKVGGAVRGRAIFPGRIYKELQDEFPDLVTKKNRGEVYKRAYQRVQDMTAAAREAARLRSASVESQRLWDKMGMDIDAQSILIQRAEAQRQQAEIRAKMQKEFYRVSRSLPRRIIHEVLSFPRAAQTSLNMHMGRQGLFFLITHPLAVSRHGFIGTGKGFASLTRAQYSQRVAELRAHPDFNLARDAGVDITELASTVDPMAGLTEEEFASTLASKIPHVRLSQQGFALGMNTERVYAFSLLASIGRSEGYTWESNPEFFKQMAAFVNDATGRGNLPDLLKRASVVTNYIFYATRLNVSRVQLMNDLFNPWKYRSYDPVTRKIMVTEALKFVGALAALFAVAKLLGLGVSGDIDDPDFGKIRIGNTHYDITGGNATNVRFMFRFLRGLERQVRSVPLPPSDNPLTLAKNFARQKLAPWPSAALDYLTGKDVVGDPANLKIDVNHPLKTAEENVIVRMLAPIVVQDFARGIADDGWMGALKETPVLVGFGAQTYKPTYVPRTATEKLIAALKAKHSMPGDTTPEDKARMELKRDLIDRQRRGDDVKAEIQKGIDVGTLKETDTKNIDRQANMTRLQAEFNGLSLVDALTVLKDAPGAEQKELSRIVYRKIQAAEPGSLTADDLKVLEAAHQTDALNLVKERAPVEKELKRQDLKFPRVETKLTVGTKEFELTDEQAQRYQSRANSLFYERLPKAIASKDYIEAAPTTKKDIIREIEASVRKLASAEMKKELAPSMGTQFDLDRERAIDESRGQDTNRMRIRSEAGDMKKKMKYDIGPRP